MSNTIVTFERAFVKLAGDLAVDGYRSPSGEFRVGMASASVALGYDKDWISQAIKRDGITSKELSKMGFSFEVLEGFVAREKSSGASVVKTISFDDFKILIDFACKERKEKAMLLKGIPTRNKVKKGNPEKEIRDSLAESLSGRVEIPCPAGRIDILTKTEVIEVKKVQEWKSAIGQVIVYGSFFPTHLKRIHLFGQVDSETKEMILDQAKKLNICVSWVS